MWLITHKRRMINGAINPAEPKKVIAFWASQLKSLIVSLTTEYMNGCPLNGPQSALGCNLYDIVELVG